MNRSPQFPKTEWTQVVQVIGEKNAESFDALSKLCEDYWYPLYAFVRRQGAPADEAFDEVQGFFEALLEKDFLDGVDRNRGRLRTFLIDAMKKYRAKVHRLRKRYREQLEDVVRTTLDITVSKDDLKDELRHLLGAFS